MVKEYTILLKLFLDHLKIYTSELNEKRPKELYEPEQYILNLGGKRLRPLLALIACDMFGADPRNALNAAMSVELFHNFSLIHDDILDAAPLRRNQATVHKKWNTNIAILSGDVMLVKAFDVLQTEEANQLKNLLNVFTQTSIEVCEGQQWDMNFEQEERVSVEDYIQMISFKTAVLLGCSLQMGAICANATNIQQIAIYNFGKHLGIAFQLLDDMLDAFTDKPEAFGKQVGGDIIANKKTFLLLKAMELANADQTKRLNLMLQLSTNEAEKKVSEMKALYTELNIRELVQAEADKHTAKAISFLHQLNVDSEKRLRLETFAYALLNRTI